MAGKETTRLTRPDATRTALVASALLAINLALNAPLFESGETPYRESIEPGYAGMARFFASHPGMWGWNPLPYCGLPAQFTYLPGVHYLVAVVLWAARGVPPETAYRWVTALASCLGPVTLFLFAWRFTRRRWWSAGAALAYTLVSPSYGLFTTVVDDQGILGPVPWRLQVLLKYGEGPHNFGLMLLPLALIAVWEAGVGRRYWRIFVAALLLAAVALTHWIAALAMGFACAMMLLSVWGNRAATGFQFWRAFAAAGLGYLLAAFWLTPSFVRVVAFNWPADSFNYKLRAREQAMLIALLLLLASIRLLFGRRPDRVYLCWMTLCFFGAAFVVEGYYDFGVSTIPESRRYALELELFFFCALFAWLQAAWSSERYVNRFAAAVAGLCLVVAARAEVAQYVLHGYEQWKVVPKEESLEHRIIGWLVNQRPRGRIFASGGLRFRLNVWSDLHQVGGTFESGLANRYSYHTEYQIRTGFPADARTAGEYALLQLKMLGVEYLVVHGPRSREHYRDIRNPARFDAVLPVVWREGDDTIYRVPFLSIAHALRPDDLPMGYLPPEIKPFVRVAGDPAASLSFAWRTPSHLALTGPVPAGKLVHVIMNYDAGWEARQDGQPVRVRPSRTGFVLVDARPSPATRIDLTYHGTREQRLMAGVSLAAWALALAALFRSTRRRRLLS